MCRRVVGLPAKDIQRLLVIQHLQDSLVYYGQYLITIVRCQMSLEGPVGYLWLAASFWLAHLITKLS